MMRKSGRFCLALLTLLGAALALPAVGSGSMPASAQANAAGAETLELEPVPELLLVSSSSVAVAGAVAAVNAGQLCLDCDTHADCDRLCGSRGFSFGACLRDLDQVCSINPFDKICACF